MSTRRPKRAKRLTILGRAWLVRWSAAPMRGVFGLCDTNARAITLCRTLSDKEAIGILAHELQHAVDYETEEPRAWALTDAMNKAPALLGIDLDDD